MTCKRIAVIGIGRVGLPLSLVLARAGFVVTGVDRNQDKIERIKKKRMPFHEEGAATVLRQVYGRGFSIVHEKEFAPLVPNADAIILTLGTTIDNTLSPSVSQITDFFHTFHTHLRKGQLIVLRSTVSPGTTEYIAHFLKTTVGMTVGRDIFLAYCPERIAEGHAIQELWEIPQAIGAFDDKSKKLAASIFSKITREILYTDPKSAELSKLYCNMYRYIDFAIGNEFALIAQSHDRDIYEILRLVNHNYKRGGVKSPGFTAGACLVKDGFFLIDKSPYLDLVTAAWRVNESMPGFLTDKLTNEYGTLTNKKVAILGMSFKRNIDDTRYSLSLKLQNYLINAGAVVSTYDPVIEGNASSVEKTIKGADCVIFAVNHDSFYKIKLTTIAKHAKKTAVICDIWNIFGVGKIIFPVAKVPRPTR